jgi:hypothetical protein
MYWFFVLVAVPGVTAWHLLFMDGHTGEQSSLTMVYLTGPNRIFNLIRNFESLRELIYLKARFIYQSP